MLGICTFYPFIRLGGLASCLALLDFFPILVRIATAKKPSVDSLLTEFGILGKVLPFLSWLDIHHCLTMSWITVCLFIYFKTVFWGRQKAVSESSLFHLLFVSIWNTVIQEIFLLSISRKCRSWCSAASLPCVICDGPALSRALCLPSLSFPSVGFHVLLEKYAKRWNAVLPWLSSLSAFVLYSCLKIWGVFLFLFSVFIMWLPWLVSLLKYFSKWYD